MRLRRTALLVALESMSAKAEIQPEETPNEEGVSTPAEEAEEDSTSESVAAAVAEEATGEESSTPAPEAEPDEVEVIVADADYVPADVADEDCDLIDIVDIIGEIHGKSRDMDETARELGEVDEAADDLEDLAQGAEKVEDTQEARMLLEVAVENIYNKLGLDNPHVAMEDAGGLDSSVKSKISAIREGVIKLLRALLEAIKRAFEEVRNYLKRIFDVAGRIEKNAIDLSKVVKMTAGHEASGYVTNERLVRALAVTKQTSFKAAFSNMAELVQDAYKSSKSGHVDFFNDLVNSFADGKDVDHLRDEIPRVLERAFSEMLPNENSGPVVDVVDVPEGVTVLSSHLMPGNYVGILTLPKDTNHLRELSYDVRRIDEDQEKLGLPVLSSQEMMQTLAEVIRVCATIRRFERDVNDHGRFVSRVSDAIKRFDQKGAENISSQDRDFLRSITAMAPALARGIHERTFAYAVSTCAATVRYVEISAGKHAGQTSAEIAKNRLAK